MTIEAGYRITPQTFEAAEIGRVLASLPAQITKRSRAGARHLLGTPVVRELASDARMLALAGEFVGARPRPFRATLFDKSSEANWLVVWHQDTALPLRHRIDAPGWGPWSTKAGVLYAHAPAAALEQVVALRLHLDDNTSSNGPLRVLPGTHTMGLLSDEQMGELSGRVGPIECVAEAGSVVAMRPLLAHSSSKARGTGRRRVLHIEYAARQGIGADVDLAEA